VLVFIRTSPFRPQDRQYSRSITVPLRLPSADTLRIAGAALEGLKRIFRPGYRYAKAGVMLLDLQPAGVQAQQELDLGWRPKASRPRWPGQIPPPVATPNSPRWHGPPTHSAAAEVSHPS
jgi:hypothetical protein